MPARAPRLVRPAARRTASLDTKDRWEPITALTETWAPPTTAGHLYLGIDVGRHGHLVAAVPEAAFAGDRWQSAPVRRFETGPVGYAALGLWLETFGVPVDEVRAGLEPTGGYYAQTIAAWLRSRGYAVAWLQNWAVHDQRQLLVGKQTKTDAIDARLIARLLWMRDQGLASRAFLDAAPSPAAETLRLLVRNRWKLTQLRARHLLQLMALLDVTFPELRLVFRSSSVSATSLRLLTRYPTPAAVAAAPLEELEHLIVIEAHAPKLKHAVPELQRLAASSVGLADGIEELVAAQQWLIEAVHTVGAEIERLDAEIERALDAWPARDRQVLASFPALGTIRMATLLAAIGDVHRFRDDRALRKYLGWYAELTQSGSSVERHRLGRVGERHARRTIWLWALSLVTPQAGETPFKSWYLALRARGMRGNVAIGHLASKLVSVVYFCLLRGEAYDPERHWRELGLTPGAGVHSDDEPSDACSGYGTGPLGQDVAPAARRGAGRMSVRPGPAPVASRRPVAPPARPRMAHRPSGRTTDP